MGSKASLLEFIEYKLRYDDNIEQTLEYCRSLSYEDLKIWAIRNDIID